MGMAASQARLLTLTARKSDLEYRAQQITNSEMILAMQTEVAAKEYSNAMSNTKYQVNTYTNDTAKETIWADMTAEQLFGVMGYGMRSDNGEKITLDNYEELLANGDSMAQKIKDSGLVVTNGGELAWTQSTTVTEFFLKLRDIKDTTDTNYFFMSEVLKLTNAIITRIQDLQMKMR